MDIQTATAGRVTKIDLDLPEDVQKVEIDTRPENGTLTVDPDQQTLSYVSTDPGFTGRMPVSWSVTHADGRVETVEREISVETGQQREGWGGGESHYMLRTDENDDVIVETGDNHRKVYVSGSDDALSRQDIERMEGVTFKNYWDFDNFLKENPQYGGSEDMALNEEMGERVWSLVTGRHAEPNSNWLMFERGYDYAMDRLVERGTQGEDPLHPVHVTAWGEGDAPVMTDRPQFYQEPSGNIVVTDIDFADGVRILNGENLLFEDVSIGGDQMIVQNATGLTLRQSDIIDIVRETPVHYNWSRSADDRKQGIYAENSKGLLIEDTLFDHNGWEKGYSPDGDRDSGQPPTKFSHNVYLHSSMLDVTFRDNVTMRAASTGTQLRGGAFAEDNLYLDNNIAGNFGGGWNISSWMKSGNYSFVNGNVVTSAAYKDGLSIGARSMGFDDYAKQTTFLGNIIAHLANPDDPDDIARKYWDDHALKHNASRFFDDTIVHNWDTAYPHNGSQERNTDGIDPPAMAETTIQRYAAELLGTDTATIDDLAQHLRQVVRQGGDLDVDDILNYFRAGFGQDQVVERGEAGTITFVPSELGEGTRWDNRVNWDKGGLPIDGDAVDLNGSHVRYGGSVDLAKLDLGGTGALALGYGYLGVEELVGGGRLDIDRAGQFWVDGWSGSGTLEVTLDGGRFVNTGRLGGALEVEATDGELVLAMGGGRLDLDGGTLRIVGDEAKVGFDGTDGRAAGLDLDGGTLGFKAEGGAFGQIAEFRTGAFETHDVTSLVDLEGGRIEVDLGDLRGGGTYDLLSVDGLGGVPDDVIVTGLGGRDAVMRIDLAEDRVELVLTTGGSGQTRVEVLDETPEETASEASLWQTIPSDGTVPAAPEPDPVPDETAPETPEPEAPEAPETETPTEDETPEQDTAFTLDIAPPDRSGMVTHESTDAAERIDGTANGDWIDAGGGNDYLGGGDGNDAIFGGDGDDRMDGGGGDDHLDGGRGNDHLMGGNGADVLIGNDGWDRLFGNDGDDILMGGTGTDMLAGGAGADRFVFDLAELGAGDVDQIYDFDAGEGDRIVLIGQDGTIDHTYDATADLSVLSAEIEGEMRDVVRFYGDDAPDLGVAEQGNGYLILG